MTLAIAINILLSAIALIAIIGLLSWSILTSRHPRTSSPALARNVRERSSDRRRRQRALAKIQSQA
jgi:hypothetical protein